MLHALPDQLQGDVALIFKEITDYLPDLSSNSPGDSAADSISIERDWISVLPAVLSASRFISGLLRKDISYLTEIIDDGSLFSPLDSEQIASLLAESLAATDDQLELMHTPPFSGVRETGVSIRSQDVLLKEVVEP